MKTPLCYSVLNSLFYFPVLSANRHIHCAGLTDRLHRRLRLKLLFAFLMDVARISPLIFPLSGWSVWEEQEWEEAQLLLDIAGVNTAKRHNYMYRLVSLLSRSLYSITIHVFTPSMPYFLNINQYCYISTLSLCTWCLQCNYLYCCFYNCQLRHYLNGCSCHTRYYLNCTAVRCNSHTRYYLNCTTVRCNCHTRYYPN